MTNASMGDPLIRNLPKRTGRTLEEWLELLETEGPTGHYQRLEWLATEHGMGPFTAAVIVERAGNGEPSTTEAPTQQAVLAAQYAGLRAKLRPVLDRLLEVADALGDDVAVNVRQLYVTLGRRGLFAAIQPSTRTRVDLGLALGELPTTERLHASTGFGGDIITHRVGLSTVDDVDDQVVGWLRAAYDLDAER